MSSQQSSAGLVRALGPMMATAVVVGTVIGSGIFKKAQPIAENLPFFGLVALAWIAGGVLAMLGALAYAEVATLYPRAGGNYVFLREGYGRPFGFLWGWVDFFMIRSGSIAALATMFTISFRSVLLEWNPSLAERFDYWPQRLLTVAVILSLAWVNARGVKWGGGLQLFITLVKVGSLLFLIALPFIALMLVPKSADFTPRSADAANMQPIWPSANDLTVSLLSGFATALLGVLWAYHGWMNVAPVAEEVKEPQRNLPLAFLLGVGVVIVLYLGTTLAYYLVLSGKEMELMKEGARDNTVAIGFCRMLLGHVGVGIAAAAVMISVFGALNGNLMVGPRLLFAMSRDRLAPAALATIHPQTRTPLLAIWVQAGWACALVLGVAALQKAGWLNLKKDPFDILTDMVMFGAVIFETMAVLSIFQFRRKYPDVPRPYRCIGYPWVPALYVLLPALILANMGYRCLAHPDAEVREGQIQETLLGLGFMVMGVVVYYAARLGRTDLRQPAENGERPGS